MCGRWVGGMGSSELKMEGWCWGDCNGGVDSLPLGRGCLGHC